MSEIIEETGCSGSADYVIKRINTGNEQSYLRPVLLVNLKCILPVQILHKLALPIPV